MTPAAQALLALAEAERALVADDAAGRAEELLELADRREEIIAMLPAALDAQDRAAVALALQIQVDSTRRMRAARDELAADLKHIGVGRRTARGYAPGGLAQQGSLSLHG